MRNTQRWLRLTVGGPTTQASVSAMTAMGIRGALQGCLLIFLARGMGSTDFGAFVAMTSLALGLGTLAPVGQGYLVLLHSAISDERGRRALARALPITFLGSLCLYPIYGLLAGTLQPDPLQWWPMVLLGLSELTCAPLTLVMAQRLQGLGSVGTAQSVFSILSSLRLGGVLAVAALHEALTLSAYAAIYLASAAAVLLLTWALASRAGSLPDPRNYRRPSSKSIRPGLPYAAMRLSAYGPGELDKVIAPSALGLSAAGNYAFVSRAMGLAMLPVNALVAASQPRITRLLKTSPHDGFRLAATSLIMSAMWGTLCCIALWVVGAVALGALAGDRYDLALTSHALALACIPMSVRITAGGLLLPVQRPMIRAASEFSGMACLAIAMPLLAARHGIAGAAAAVIGSELIMALLLSLAALRHLRRLGRPQ